MKYLLTGGCGFIGSNLADAVLAEGHEVAILDNLSRVGAKENLDWLRIRYGSEWQFIEGDIRNYDLISQLIKEYQPEVIAHLAGQVAATTSIQDPRYDFEVNVIGSINVLEAVRLFSPSSVVLYSSTNKVYGSLEYLQYEETATRYKLIGYPEGLDESLPLDGHTPYGCSKLAADQYMRDYYRIYGIPTVVFRHSSMYGGRQFSTYDQGWVGWFCMKALEMSNPNTKPFTISGNGKQVRDVLHIDDLIQVYLAASKNIEVTAGQVYNIGGGISNSLSLLELFELLEEFTSNTIRFQKLAWRVGDQKFFVANNYKANSEFGWLPRQNKKDGILKMLDWCRELN